jgi:hypothetical protein
MKSRIRDKLFPKKQQNNVSLLKQIISGTFFRMSDLRGDTDLADIQTQIDTMRALAADSQISTALSYYATDATTTNTAGQIIWATADDSDLAEVINDLFDRWNVNAYARDHILELATIGNLYIPTTEMYKTDTTSRQSKIALDNNTIPNNDFDIVPSTKVPPEDIIHLWHEGEPAGYIYKPSQDNMPTCISYPESAVIHFSLGGLLGDYTIDVRDNNNEVETYDIQFAQPLMERAVQPTQTLNLLEDAVILSSLSKVIRFVSVDCGQGVEDEEIQDTLLQLKNTIEQQLSINTNNGDVQSYVNPQSPNNFIFLPKVNGADPISITDLNMQENADQNSAILTYYQDKKLSVLGVPKEAMNFSSNEGLGGAGSVLSQRSALYANSLQRLETAYMAGWRKALNIYFEERGFSGYVDKFDLHMNPIITQQSTIQFEKRDAALSQATTFVQLLKDAGVSSSQDYVEGLVEILSEVFPQMGADVNNWKLDPTEGEGGGMGEI